MTLQTSRNEDGFTLVETLVALALLALISVYGFTALAFAKAYDRIGKKIEASMHEELAFERIRELMTQFQSGLYDNEKAPHFSALRNELQFLALSDGKSIPGGLVQIRLRGNEFGNLVMQWQHYPVGNANYTLGEVVVMNNVGEIQFSYGETREPKDFTESWKLLNVYPRVVKLSVRKKSSGDGIVTSQNMERIFSLGANIQP